MNLRDRAEARAASAGSGPVSMASSSLSPSSASSSSSAFSSGAITSTLVGFCGCAMTSGAFGSMKPTITSTRPRLPTFTGS